MTSDHPVALTIAGSDSSAGAGLQADLKTFQHFGVYGICVVTSIVSELPGKVSRLEYVSDEIFRDQMELMFSHFPVSAMKTGLIPACTQMEVLADILSGSSELQLVVDPVMIASSGDRLMKEEAQDIMESRLIPLATLVTPNLDEASIFLGERITNEEEMREAGGQLARRWKTAVLMKGGHLAGREAVDLLFEDDQFLEMRSAYLQGVDTHGTGCTLSAAITAGLARGKALSIACQDAKRFLSAAMEQRHFWQGRGGSELTALNHSVSW